MGGEGPGRQGLHGSHRVIESGSRGPRSFPDQCRGLQAGSADAPAPQARGSGEEAAPEARTMRDRTRGGPGAARGDDEVLQVLRPRRRPGQALACPRWADTPAGRGCTLAPEPRGGPADGREPHGPRTALESQTKRKPWLPASPEGSRRLLGSPGVMLTVPSCCWFASLSIRVGSRPRRQPLPCRFTRAPCSEHLRHLRVV